MGYNYDRLLNVWNIFSAWSTQNSKLYRIISSCNSSKHSLCFFSKPMSHFNRVWLERRNSWHFYKCSTTQSEVSYVPQNEFDGTRCKINILKILCCSFSYLLTFRTEFCIIVLFPHSKTYYWLYILLNA